MDRKVASKETIDSLIENSIKSIRDSEFLLGDIELIKENLYSNDSAESFWEFIFELMSGSLMGVQVLYGRLRDMLLTSSIYAKRFNMQMINLSQFEWCKYLNGSDKKGILARLILFCDKHNYDSSNLLIIQKKVQNLGKQCNVVLRKMTAHYDEPEKMYKELLALNDEDIYARRVGSQLEIHDMILKYTGLIIQAIQNAQSQNGVISSSKLNLKTLNIDIINDKVCEALSARDDLKFKIEKQLSKAWNDIESLKRNIDGCDKAKEFLKNQKINYDRITELQSVVRLRMVICFMRYDLACSILAYLNSKSNTERSVCFMNVYRIETSALSHLYGYDDHHRQRSIWHKVKDIPEYKSNGTSSEIEATLISMTSDLDSHKRNLYIHYREDEKFNISERWKCAKHLNHPKELMQVLKLINLCKDIDVYLGSLLSEMKAAENKKIDDTFEPIRKIKELACKKNLKEIVSMSDKLLSIFSFK